MDVQECPGLGTALAVQLFYFLVPVLLLFATWLCYKLGGRSRNRYLDRQEEELNARIRVTSLKSFPVGSYADPVLVCGSAAIANNYFISFLAGFKHLFGGELKGYTAMCKEARRLALVRLLQEADALGANAVYNVRFETATIVSANNNKQVGGVELIAYGTAVRQTQPCR